jgi:hypothetical protein
MSTATATKSTGTFEILMTDVVLGDSVHGQPHSSVRRGDVARLQSGRVLGRVRTHYGFTYGDFHSDPRQGFEANLGAQRWEERLKNEIERMRYSCGARVQAPTAFAAECQKFRQQFPGIAARLGLEKERPSPVLSVGETSVAIRQPQGILGEDVWTFIDRHAAGDWGQIGHADLTPLSPEEEWGIDLLEPARRNSASVLQGSGPVISTFELPEAMQTSYRKARGGEDPLKLPVTVRILTMLKGGVGSSVVLVGTETW